MSKRRYIHTFSRRAKKRGYDELRCRALENAAFKRLHMPQWGKDLLEQPDTLQTERQKRNPRYNGDAARCARCREYKLPTEFTPQKNRANRPHGYCKECRRELDRERRFALHKHGMGKRVLTTKS